MSSESEIITCEDLKVSLSRLIDLHNKFKSPPDIEPVDLPTDTLIQKTVSPDEVFFKLVRDKRDLIL